MAAMTTANRDRWMLTIVGFSLPAWAFAFRTWAAMMTALYAAFWLQLDGASTAGVTVSILALQTRGQAYERSIYLVLATIIGIIASLVIAGLFPQTRELFTIGFAAWLGLCVYGGGLLDGGRAYGAMLSGYTVAQVAVTQIDSPQNVFLVGVDRGAAVLVGIGAVVLVSDMFAAPSLYAGLTDQFAAVHRRVRAFALAILGGQSADPIQSANVLREITALRRDIAALVVDSSDGLARRAAAHTAAVALVGEVSAAAALASFSETKLQSFRKAIGDALADGLGKESHLVQLRLQREAQADHSDPDSALFFRHAADLLAKDRTAKDSIESLQMGHYPSRRINAPIYRSHRAAARNGLRAFLAVLISVALFSLGGWPFTSQVIVLVGVIVALSANTANPAAFAAAAVIAVPIAILLAGVTDFLVLGGVDPFPLLAIGMAPSVLAAALLSTTSDPRLHTIGFVAMVFFPMTLSPSNPEHYDPDAYLFSSFVAITSMVLLSVLLQTIFPTTDTLRRRWYLTSARAEMHALLANGPSRPLDDEEALFRDADRIGQLAALQPAPDDESRDDLRGALEIFGRAAAVRRLRTTLSKLSVRTGGRFVHDAYSALADCDPRGLRRAAADLARAATGLNLDARAVARAAGLDLVWTAFLIESTALRLDLHGSISS
jgi:uncharacterized membrane protein YccC